ncbi:CoA transferase [Nocardioides sp. zg-536]|uniref:CoA transferase n=1 Tax=Nocardioides faecalis TaxID=2803858 RepID=A0A938Y795_9ACTN|nr:CoA transferase [Nocardioides faecalis]MBM9459165.1 CoA transferase [Nocardioides faecalis]QVI59693.1 CoA transferase [Nocardioides faecalis]
MKPLEDIRIISLEQYGAGPFGSVHLADLGAEVIKIEDPSVGGDVGRYVPPYFTGEDSLFFETFNRNKKSISLDIKTPAGRAVFEDLVRNADAVYSNLRGDVPEKIGITYDQLKHLNPAIVCCSLTGFGMTGPRMKEPGYDYVLQGLAGWMELTGEPDGPPTKSGLSLVDFSGGYVAALSLMAGLHAAKRDGIGMDCDVSLYDTAMAMLTYPATWHLNAGYTPSRTSHSAHPSLVPFQAFEASDGWFVVGCAKEKFWKRLAEVLGHPEWAEEGSPYASFSGRNERREELIAELDAIFATNTVEHWLSLCYPAAIPCGPINDVEAALKDEHLIARNMLVETDHPRYGTVKQVASPVKVGAEVPDYVRAPQRNEHFTEVLTGVAGYDAERIAELRAAGAFGDVPAVEG